MIYTVARELPGTLSTMAAPQGDLDVVLPALRGQGVDTLVFCGVSTSGCVRATVVDGFSHGFRSFVVDECCFDRSEFAHAANLFDMNAKYAAVVSLAQAEALIGAEARAAAE